jgi:hypothetical protein
VSPWRRERLSLGLDAGALLRAGSPVTTESQPRIPGVWTAARVREAIQAQMQAATRYTDAHVLVCADLCRHFVQQPPTGLRALVELQTLSTARASQLYGGKAADWSVVADWSLQRPFICAALPSSLLLSLRQACAELRLSLTVESAVLVALERLMPLAPSPGFIAWATPNGAVLAHLGNENVTALRCIRLKGDQSFSGLVDTLSREMVQESLRENLSAQVLRLVFAERLSASGQDSANPVQIESLDARTALPASNALDCEAGWASRLAELVDAEE